MLLQYWHLILPWCQTSILRNFPNWQHWTFDVAWIFSINIAPILLYHVPMISRQNDMSILHYLCYCSIDISFCRDIKLQYCEIFQIGNIGLLILPESFQSILFQYYDITSQWYHDKMICQYCSTYGTAVLTSHFAVISNFNIAKFSKSATLNFGCCQNLFNQHCLNIIILGSNDIMAKWYVNAAVSMLLQCCKTSISMFIIFYQATEWLHKIIFCIHCVAHKDRIGCLQREVVNLLRSGVFRLEGRPPLQRQEQRIGVWYDDWFRSVV